MGNKSVWGRTRFLAAISLAIAPSLCFAATGANSSTTAAPGKFFVLPIASQNTGRHLLYRYGVPFLVTSFAPVPEIKVGTPVKRLFLLGLTETQRVSAWSNPLDMSRRFFIGDNLGSIRLTYADGTTQNFPLILGESVWWGLPFYQTRQPFPTDAHLRSAFAQSIHLYPAAPVDDGNYVAVINPRPTPLASIEVLPSPDKKGSVAIAGITAETAQDQSVPGLRLTPFDAFDPKFAQFMQQKPLRLEGVDEAASKARLNDLSLALYSSDARFKQPIPAKPVPAGYSGPRVTFKGTNYATVLQNAFYANVEDMLAKVDATGFYHTSTKGALAWAGVPWSAGGEFGTWRNGVGVYYTTSWSRDLGRTMQELADLGFLGPATRGLDLALLDSRLWENPALTYHGQSLPPHWSRIINRPDPSLPFENDGHGLISLGLYKLWQRLPDRDTWLRAHWTDVKAAGDWIPWQFDHPGISGAKDGVLYTTGEAAGGKGYSIYADYICMTALQGLARMADSIGQTQSATLWRDQAAKMRTSMLLRYLVTDPKYGPVWTLDYAGWPNKSTVLGPLILQADYDGYDQQPGFPKWQAANQAAYQRLIDTYHPLGFYGWAMGYGQGFVTQSALLLDRMNDATTMFDWMAKQIYAPRVGSAAFIVPEGAQLDPTGGFIYRTGDQGNGVQEAEIVKSFRILLGVDDLDPQHLRIMPRMPYGWTEVAVDEYPTLFSHDGKVETALLSYRLVRTSTQMNMDISANQAIGPIAVRIGPFKNSPATTSVLINGKHPAGASVSHSGDSYWVSCTTTLGPRPAANH